MIMGKLVVYNIRIEGDFAQVEFSKPIAEVGEEGQMPLMFKMIEVALLPVADSPEIEGESSHVSHAESIG